MNPRTTAWLALAALALGVFIYLVEIRGGEQQAEVERQGKRLFPELDGAQVDRLWLTTSDGHEVSLERRAQDETWKMVEPVAAPASAGAIDAILAGLEDIEHESQIDRPADLSPFGLGDGAPRVRFEGPAGEGELVLGANTPVGGNRYVLRPAAKQIDLVRSFSLNAFEEPTDELRDKRVLPFETASVLRARFRWLGTEVAVERRDGGWWLIEPFEGPADASTIDTLLSNLTYLRAEGFIDDPSSADAQSLGDPVFSALLEGEGGDPLQLGFVAGGVLGTDEGLRAARGRSGLLYQIAADRIDDWPRRVVDYRDKTVSQFDVSEARTFELVFTGAAAPGGERAAPVRVQAELAEGGWVAGPEPMDPERAAALMAELARLEGIDIAADAMGEGERGSIGLRPPRVLIRVWGEGESAAAAPLLAEISVGDEVPGGGFFASRRGSEIVYLLDAAMASEIPVSLAAFRETFSSTPEAEPIDTPSADQGFDSASDVPEI